MGKKFSLSHPCYDSRLKKHFRVPCPSLLRKRNLKEALLALTDELREASSAKIKFEGYLVNENSAASVIVICFEIKYLMFHNILARKIPELALDFIKSQTDNARKSYRDQIKVQYKN